MEGGDSYPAISGDSKPATSGDFSMAADTLQSDRATHQQATRTATTG
jgi:hypothetical protein